MSKTAAPSGSSAESGPVPGGENLGAFLGVFSPSIPTILGLILFLRTGWVVGNVGLLPTLVIVVIAHAITLATALSLSAITTNQGIQPCRRRGLSICDPCPSGGNHGPA